MLFLNLQWEIPQSKSKKENVYDIKVLGRLKVVMGLVNRKSKQGKNWDLWDLDHKIELWFIIDPQ